MVDNTGKTILVTGVAGFLGRFVAKYFNCKGWTVVGVDCIPPENAPLADLMAYFCLRLPSVEFARHLKKYQPDLCVHCAGRASVDLSMHDPLDDYRSGPVLTFELLDVLRSVAPGCRFIFLSSAAVYGNPLRLPIEESQLPAPISPYGFHKWQGEQICLEFARIYGMQTASLRIFSAYGTGLHRQVLWDMCRKILVDNTLLLQGTGDESRDFIHVQDVAKAIGVVAEKAPMTGEIYNLGCGQETMIRALARHVLDALQSPLSPEFNGVVPQGVPLNWCADIAKLTSLGFCPTVSLQRGVAQFVGWCRSELEGL